MKSKVSTLLAAVTLMLSVSISVTAQSWQVVRKVSDRPFSEPWILEFVRYDSAHIHAFGATSGLAYPMALSSSNTGLSWDTLFYIAPDTADRWNFLEIAQDRFVSMPDSSHIYLSCKGSKIRRSTDRGKTWVVRVVDSSYTKMLDFDAIHFDTSGRGLLMRDTVVYHSTDYGDTWEKIPFAPPMPGAVYVHAMWVKTINNICAWFIGDEVQCCGRSSDGGRTWRPAMHYPREYMSDMYFVDEDYGWATLSKDIPNSSASYDGVYRTTDGGDTWYVQWQSLMNDTMRKIGSGGLSKIRFYDRSNGIAIGRSKVIRTTTGGDIWAVDRANNDGLIESVSAIGWLSKDISLVGTAMGDILRHDNYAMTSANDASTDEIYATENPVFPNPCSRYLYLRRSWQEKPAELTVTSPEGSVARLAVSFVSNETARLDVGALAPGVYSVLVPDSPRPDAIRFLVIR